MRLARDTDTIIRRFSIHEKVLLHGDAAFARIREPYGKTRLRQLSLDLSGGCLTCVGCTARYTAYAAFLDSGWTRAGLAWAANAITTGCTYGRRGSGRGFPAPEYPFQQPACGPQQPERHEQ